MLKGKVFKLCPVSIVMKKQNIIGLIVVCLIVVGSLSIVLAYTNNTRYSFDRNDDIEEENIRPIKYDCPREEWNWMFEEFRAGNIPKDEMVEYVASCNY